MKRGSALFIISILFLTVVRMSSCSVPKTVPYAEVVELPNEDLQNGRELFSSHCATCHPGGLSGLGPALINKPLPKALIRFQIRNGIGTMPAFGEEHLSDAEVKKIAAYVVYLRQNDSRD